ncbi:unnamed protein product [Sphacelaria rigidula]
MYTLIKKNFKVFLLLQAVVLGCYCPFVSGFGLRWIPVSTTSARRWRSGGGDDGGRNKATTVLSMANEEAEGMRSKILQLAALTDRGGMACSGISNAYLKTKDDMRYLVDQLSQIQPVARPLTGAQLSGRWELVYTTVELFRASPFFQMVEAGYDDPEKSDLFFKLHQLQTGSWGISRIGRVTQLVDLVKSGSLEEEPLADAEDTVVAGDGSGKEALVAKAGGGSGSLESEVDLILLPLTTIPLVGFWKLLPTFGGCIATKAYCSLSGDNNEVVELKVESTQLKAVEDVPLLPLAGSFFEGKEFPTGQVAKTILGNVPVTKQTVVYIDDGMRVMQDKAGQLFIYTRPL